MYLESIKEMPKTSVVLKSEKEDAVHFKTDIFKKEIWYVARGSENKVPFKLKLVQVHEIIEMNNNGIKPSSFFELIEVEVEEKPDYNNVVGQDSLTRFDEKKRKKKRRNWSKGSRKKQYRKNPNNKTGNNGGTHNKK